VSPPLEGVRVVELTTAWAGPFAGRVLAWFGAETFHVESATRTNTWRVNRDAPRAVNYPDLDPGTRPFDRSFLFNSQNVNKRSLAIDLKIPEGLAALRRLLDVSDVLLCNFRPGFLARIGLDRATLAQTNPGIIVLQMPAFGTSGPHAGYAALGPTMEMAAGMSAMIAYPGGEPTVTGPSYLDPIGGFNAAAAVMTALWHRDRTGEGQEIEMGQVECAMQFIGPELIAGEDVEQQGNRVRDMAPHSAYPARGEDEWIVIAATDDEAFAALCRAMDRPELARNFASLEARKQAETMLDAEIARWTVGQDKHELARRLQAAGIAAAPVNTPADLAGWDYLDARASLVELDHPEAGRHPHMGLPFHAETHRGGARTAAPCFGADNLYLLRDVLKMSDGEIEDALASGAFADRPNAGV
jgi:crotonobetainyl-CoA:carnitine CoA-transferase CaiB-like acyl-CoA transferase